eukprot:169353_1
MEISAVLLCFCVTIESAVLIILTIQTIKRLHSTFVMSKVQSVAAKLADMSNSNISPPVPDTPEISTQGFDSASNTNTTPTSICIQEQKQELQPKSADDMAPLLRRCITASITFFTISSIIQAIGSWNMVAVNSKNENKMINNIADCFFIIARVLMNTVFLSRLYYLFANESKSPLAFKSLSKSTFTYILLVLLFEVICLFTHQIFVTFMYNENTTIIIGITGALFALFDVIFNIMIVTVFLKRLYLFLQISTNRTFRKDEPSVMTHDFAKYDRLMLEAITRYTLLVVVSVSTSILLLVFIGAFGAIGIKHVITKRLLHTFLIQLEFCLLSIYLYLHFSFSRDLYFKWCMCGHVKVYRFCAKRIAKKLKLNEEQTLQLIKI